MRGVSPWLRSIATVCVLALGAVPIAACGGSHDMADHHGDDQGMTHDAAQMGTGREADVMFSQEMIPHHQQAVEMADLALDPARGASPAVQDLARRIRAAQAAEIADMRAWLGEWGAPAAGDGHMSDGHAGMGMLSEEQLQALAAAEGAAFDRLWLEGMIEHHEGALVMASHIAERGEDPRVAELSASIDEAQRAEIDEMRRLLEG